MTELAPLGFISPNFGYEILSLDVSNPNIGELCLIGPCVGLGYYNDTDRTAKAFVQNPAVSYLQTMYKTGDLVEKATNGYLHFKGRVDNQIKHMGYRIELEEIEAAFSTFPYIDEVGVVYQKINADLGQIVSFISINQEVGIPSILDDVKQVVPSYMVPRIVKVLPSLPKNQNGKIDRKQLKELL
jgi:D-alanine--poly(phosphoribitol) ligase subunit 1